MLLLIAVELESMMILMTIIVIIIPMPELMVLY